MVWFIIYAGITIMLLISNLPLMLRSKAPLGIIVAVAVLMWPLLMVFSLVYELFKITWVSPSVVVSRMRYKLRKWWYNEY